MGDSSAYVELLESFALLLACMTWSGKHFLHKPLSGLQLQQNSIFLYFFWLYEQIWQTNLTRFALPLLIDMYS